MKFLLVLWHRPKQFNLHGILAGILFLTRTYPSFSSRCWIQSYRPSLWSENSDWSSQVSWCGYALLSGSTFSWWVKGSNKSPCQLTIFFVVLCKFVLKKLTHYFFDLKELSSLVSSTWGCTVGNRQGLLLLLNGSRGRVFCLIGLFVFTRRTQRKGSSDC